MTSQTFLHKDTFIRALKKGLPLALFQLFVVSVIFPYSSYSRLYKRTMLPDGTIQNMANQYSIAIYTLSEELAPYIPLLALIAGAVFAVVLFWFIDSKRAMNVYYGVGVRRTTLFRTFYSAGALLLFLSVALPLIATGVINHVMIGANGFIWKNTIYILLSLSGMNLLGYSAAAVCMAGTGTPTEGGFNSVMFLSLPFILPASLGLLSRRFLNGSAYGLPISMITHEFSEHENHWFGTIHFIPQKYNPFQMSVNALDSKYTYINRGEEIKPSLIFDAPGALFALVFIAVLVVLFAFVAVRLFAKRKAEYCGMPNANKGMNIAAVTILGFYICCVLAVALPVNALLAVILSFLIFTVLFIGIGAIIERSFKEGLKHIKAVIVPVTVISAILVIFATGGFGFSSYVPDANEIKSARVTSAGGDLYEGVRFVVDHSSSSTFNPLNRNGPLGTAPECTYLEADEAPALIELHKKLVKTDGYKASYKPAPLFDNFASRDIAISYTLKNGKTVTRYFRNVMNDEIMEEAVLLQQNKLFKKEYKDHIIDRFEDVQNPKDFTNDPEGMGANFALSLASPFKNYAEQLFLTPEQYAELLDAILKDIDDQTARERFYPESPALGYLCFSELAPEESEGIRNGEVIAVIDKGGSAGGNAFVTLTPDMERSISLLKKWGYDSVFNAEYKPVEITAVYERDLKDYKNFTPYLESNKLSGMSGEAPGGIFKDNLNDGAKQFTTTDEKEIEAIIKASHLFYSTTEKGYMISIKETADKGKGTSDVYTAFVPENQAPDFLKNALGGK